AAISAHAASTASPWMSASATFMPALAKARAMPRPMPEAAPVTKAVLPTRSFIGRAARRSAAGGRGARRLRLGLAEVRDDLLGEELGVLRGQLVRQGAELHHRQEIAEADLPMILLELLAQGRRAAAEEHALLDH